MANDDGTTPGKWDHACDSYGKVRHSRKACVFSVVKGPGGERIVTVAARIENWADAKAIVRDHNAATAMREALRGFIESHERLAKGKPCTCPYCPPARTALALAEKGES